MILLEVTMADKMKLFIFSTSYTTRVLLRCLEYIIKIKDCNFEIILLSELGVSNNINIVIREYETLQQCVSECTQILIVCNGTIPESKIDFVKYLANIQNKHCVTVPSFNKHQNFYDTKVSVNKSINEKTLILIVSYGAQTQLSCWETILYKFLCDNKIKVFSTPSNELNSVFECVSSCDLANSFFKDFFVTETECEVAVRTLQYDPDIDNETNHVLSQLNPDVIIVSICNNHYNYDEIRNIFKFKYGRVIDIFAKSELLEMNDETGKRKMIFNFSSYHNEEASTVFLNDPLLIQQFSKIILPKIMLPNDVTII